MTGALKQGNAALSGMGRRASASLPAGRFQHHRRRGDRRRSVGGGVTVCELSTDDGPALLFNIHLSEHRAAPVEFPASGDTLPDSFARRLFGMSSPLPPHLQVAARQEGYPPVDGTRGFVFNADAAAVIQFLDIGTRPANLR